MVGNKTSIRPEDVSQKDAQRVLNFLNTAQTAAEIVETADIPKVRDISVKVAQRILDRRKALGYFSTLQQVADVPQVGPERFTEIVQSLRKSVTEDIASWESVHVRHFVQFLYPGRDSGTVGVIQLLDEENNLVAWVWLHDQESLPETYVFPYNGRVEMHFKVSQRSDLIDMLQNETTQLHFSIERQEAYLTDKEVSATSDRRRHQRREPDGGRRRLGQRQNVVQTSPERRKGTRRQSERRGN